MHNKPPHTYPMKATYKGRRRSIAVAAPAALMSLAYLSRHHWGGVFDGVDDTSCKVSLGKYSGPRYHKQGETLKTTCVVENNWMQLSQHVVSLGGKSKDIINDWLFIDYHDRINVLVEAWDDDDDQTNDKRYVVFKQTKYAYSGDSLAIVGGIIEPNEEPEVAARREVQEEMKVNCETLASLGKYRTDVNRGMGWVHSFIASDCSREMTNRASANDSEEMNQVGAADTEGQERILLTVAELRDAARNGEFVEVQWSNTVALALLRIAL